MTETRQWHLASRPTGIPKQANFKLVETELPALGNGEVLATTRYLSVDPYMRGRIGADHVQADAWGIDQPLHADAVIEVEESRHPEWEVGDVARTNIAWSERSVLHGSELERIDPDRAPVSTALGVLGMPGATAYFGTTEVAEPHPGDTFVVSGAAGAVGSVAGQLANLAGSRVVGTAGTEEKVTWLTEDLGFEAAINYRAADDLGEAITNATPDGVDVYFDNVGGPITDAVWTRLNQKARVAVCGQIALYNATEQPTGPRKLRRVGMTRARVEGFTNSEYRHRWEEAFDRMSAMIDTEKLQYRESIVDGFERAPEAFVGLFDGENIGKQLVEVS